MRRMILAAAGLVFFSASHAAGDPVAGKMRSASCAACHGNSGISTNPSWPNLAGQKERYLVKALKDFRDGKREHPSMRSMMRVLSDADIDNLAAYYSGL